MSFNSQEMLYEDIYGILFHTICKLFTKRYIRWAFRIYRCFIALLINWYWNLFTIDITFMASAPLPPPRWYLSSITRWHRDYRKIIPRSRNKHAKITFSCALTSPFSRARAPMHGVKRDCIYMYGFGNPIAKGYRGSNLSRPRKRISPTRWFSSYIVLFCHGHARERLSRYISLFAHRSTRSFTNRFRGVNYAGARVYVYIHVQWMRVCVWVSECTGV